MTTPGIQDWDEEEGEGEDEHAGAGEDGGGGGAEPEPRPGDGAGDGAGDGDGIGDGADDGDGIGSDGSEWEEVPARPAPAFPGGPRPGAAPPPAEAPRPSAPPVLLRFQEVHLTLTVPPGSTVGLGRDPEWAPRTARALAAHRTVSGRHASVAVAADGTATVTEEPPGPRNGTRLDGTDLVTGVAHPLRDGALIRLGPRISCRVTLGRPAGTD
ncbi:FHA domain-containing protein [Streptomyces sp. NPDC097619]|uniref:FHA domain-containing protein n=1 Tax=Streptomyces sp. NPDC097619 TaxID=3157228 RepID=UPI003324F95F